ncbi:2-oxo-4-hydroxy-4-carboxy-5-ureidoimidazoline decarboxylase [Nocardia terpenica]|uniref:2-oxo-4-hydroxy-4-carboxy-5-ureidoimidazoline decarboxylase n=1 Tax=Nocardia terpenica TaxID=455432 RepID=UPI0018933FC3|nr:2-oxo-4-hydroxy-4-carboxy-5-ureidoimidazoline decarboxylase [Nocardia terpenica]MBF6060073.1 2-oxo-4-hydroxy-4-carboxy-5-ureidoimidazoline decarboxylase [Nocardia terpenica]MBF6103333.1 2-oxo-4-hydroxy-4-carboxy-5-ureidoimidazoline decarboxylase [Nocardia terpenica]MBF6112293.1 2-oxo-4-hydroxy-4-carboxy-5-ureidoimidazoline decarboxylase [Nocardia terpenica]MBF6117554.1 2-oxo-4-hydroxy-4-carboxy-5-ureidoimidazoline decarboxylase [Nocardia terpenica]MBF6157301.1 2-oxo-4-hydroxy-4-carboxy-5-ur
MTTDEIDLRAFDALPAAAAVELLLSCCSSPVWAGEVAAARPVGSVEALLAAADAALAELSEDELDRALAGHPRIGATPDTAASAREQAGVAGAPDAVRAALAAGNRAYEQRFGHVYLVCATGRSAAELLDILRARLHNDPHTERGIVRAELAKINHIRLRRLVRAEVRA